MYFKAMVSFGHQGRGNTTEGYIYIKARDILTAMKKAKRFPAVKHSRTPLKIEEVTEEEYNEGINNNVYSNVFYEARKNASDNL